VSAIRRRPRSGTCRKSSTPRTELDAERIAAVQLDAAPRVDLHREGAGVGARRDEVWRRRGMAAGCGSAPGEARYGGGAGLGETVARAS